MAPNEKEKNLNQMSFYGDSYYWRRQRSPWLSVAEAAYRVGMSEKSVRRYAREGAFVAIQPERYIRIDRATFEAWMASRRYARVNDGGE